MFALGRLFNLTVSATTTATRVNMKNAVGLTVVASGATTGNVTISESNAASGGTTQALARITAYWTQTAGVWTRTTQAAAATAPLTAAGITVFEVETSFMSDGFSYLSVSCPTANSSMVLLQRDLEVQRNPTFLANLSA